MALLFFQALQNAKGLFPCRGQPFFCGRPRAGPERGAAAEWHLRLMASSPNGVLATPPRADNRQTNIGREE